MSAALDRRLAASSDETPEPSPCPEEIVITVIDQILGGHAQESQAQDE